MDEGIAPGAHHSAPVRRGRPARFSDAERERLILDALERVIAEQGLHGATMTAVAAVAGMSKRTLYAVFESRDALFARWVRRLRASFVRPLSPDETGLPLPERLHRLLRLEAAVSGSHLRVAVLRAVIAEAPRHPALALMFFREGPATGRAIVREELERAAALGEIRVADVAQAARLLHDMAYPSPLDALLTSDQACIDGAGADARLRLAIRVFLEGVAQAPASPQGVARA